MVCCAILGCTNHDRQQKHFGFHFHRFPRNNETKLKWLNACKRATSFSVDTARVCSRHFDELDYMRDLKGELLNLPLKRVLKPDSVPHLNLTILCCTIVNTNRHIYNGRKIRAIKRHSRKKLQNVLQSLNNDKACVKYEFESDERCHEKTQNYTSNVVELSPESIKIENKTLKEKIEDLRGMPSEANYSTIMENQEELVTVKQEYSDEDIKHEEVCFETIHVEEPYFMDEIEISNDIKLENDELEFSGKEGLDEITPVIEIKYIKEEIYFDEDQPAINESDPLALSQVTESNIKAESTIDEETTAEIDSSSSISKRNDVLHICEKCNIVFTTFDQSEEHRKICLPTDKSLIDSDTCTENRAFKCNKCDYFASQQSGLKRHMQIHSGEKIYSCSECDYISTKIVCFNRHLRNHSGEKPYKCKQCNYSTCFPYDLAIHMRIHSGEKPYKCSECDYSATQSSNLKVHMRIHSGEKPFKCSRCNYFTSQSYTLYRHMRVHTGEKTYTCSQCNYSTKQIQSLKTHMKVHSGEKLYTCSQCDYLTTQAHRLKTHMRVHSGEKPYKCVLCSFSAAQSGNLSRHMKRHTEEILY